MTDAFVSVCISIVEYWNMQYIYMYMAAVFFLTSFLFSVYIYSGLPDYGEHQYHYAFFVQPHPGGGGFCCSRETQHSEGKVYQLLSPTCTPGWNCCRVSWTGLQEKGNSWNAPQEWLLFVNFSLTSRFFIPVCLVLCDTLNKHVLSELTVLTTNLVLVKRN